MTSRFRKNASAFYSKRQDIFYNASEAYFTTLNLSLNLEVFSAKHEAIT